MASTTSKTGSPIRKGFIYQDHVALRFALECYIRREEFELFTEYRKAKSFDDILIVFSDRIEAYQVKHATDPNDVYILADFIDPADPRNKRVYFEKFSKSWKAIQQLFPTKQKTLYLHTNHALDAELFEVAKADGAFNGPFIRGTHRKDNSKKIRTLLKDVTHLKASEFKEFLSCFRFQIKEPALPELIQHIKADLLDHQLGLSSRDVYQDLKELIEDFSMNRHEALTRQHLDKIFAKAQQRYLLPQKFEVDRKLFVERGQLQEQLGAALKKSDSGYIVVTGPPGSGKSTSLTAYFDKYEKQSKAPVFRYYCFVDINDNYQNRRVEAESLRVNLLSALQERFPAILTRRFDYREEQFLQALTTLGQHFSDKQQKLVVFLDGLDHAERMESEIQDHLLRALPRALPQGVVFVVGTRELRSWSYFFKQCETTYIKMPLFTPPQTRLYLTGKHELTGLSEEHIGKIHWRSEGLPLYLRYIAEKILEKGDVEMTLSHFPQIRDGDINRYHELLWQEFERQGQGATRYVCSLLACLRFPICQDDLAELQQELRSHEFEDCFQQIQHLLKHDGPFSEIFHSSFKEFVLSTLTPKRIQTLHQEIATYLIARKDDEPRYSDLWFRFVFEYAHRAEDYAYILNTVDRKFVDLALLHYQPNQTIENAIFWAIESARETSDLLALSRLGALKYRSEQRIQHLLNRELLSHALLALGRHEDVIRYTYSLRHNQWLIEVSTALNVLKILALHDKRDLGEWLFSILVKSIRGKSFDTVDDVINYAYCLGIYGRTLSRPLRWLARLNLEPGIDEELLAYVPGYNPVLESYVEAIVAHRPDACWRRLKKVKKLFPNQLIRYFLIRAIARHKEKQVLRAELEEYLSLFQPTSNPELVCYAAFTGLSSTLVTQTLGMLVLPPLDIPDRFYRNNPILHNYRMTFMALGKSEALESIRQHISRKQSWWTNYVLYLLHVGECVGQHWAGSQSDWFDSAITAINILCHLRQSDKDREMWTLLDVCRSELHESLFSLIKAVAEQYPERLSSWLEQLQRLPDSELWTRFYGVKDVSHNFMFELKLYERLSSIPRCRRYLLPILERCAERYRESRRLKGENRSEHFLRLSSIVAQCAYTSKAQAWLQEGIRSTLIYGYHKDVTLFQLVDIMELLNKLDRHSGLERCADILEMIAWLPSLTDNDEVSALPEHMFVQVVKLHKQAALRLLREYAQDHIQWLVEDCVQTFIEQVDDVETEILWAFSSVLNDHVESAKVKAHIVERVEQSGDMVKREELKQRLDRFIRTHVPLHRWAELNSEVWRVPDSVPPELSSQPRRQTLSSQPQNYTLDGNAVTIEEIEKRFSASFEIYRKALEQLKVENRGFFESELSRSALQTHISQAASIAELIAIKEFICEWTNVATMQQLADRFIDSGELEYGVECLQFVYRYPEDWPKWKKNQRHLRAIADYAPQKVAPVTAEESYRSLTKYSGFDTPGLVANAYYVLEDVEHLKKVYDEYFNYCEELFAQLPREDSYQWLKTYSAKPDDWRPTAIHFLVDVLDTPDIVSGHRLIDAYRELCLKRQELVLPVFIERLSDAVDVAKDRLLSILYIVSYHAPQLLLPYADKIAKHLDSGHFMWKMLLLKLLQNVQHHGTVSEQTQQKIESAKFHYSSGVSSSTFRLLHASPSFQFAKLFKERTLGSIQRQIASCCQVLELDVEAVLAKIEQTLMLESWTVEDAQVKLKDDWRDYVHASGSARDANIVITCIKSKGKKNLR
ncbi:MAG: AAA family ATPase [bacterium]|nr:AAA family ATPase [bacterium]